MNINQKAKEFAMHVKSTDEFKYMNTCKTSLEKNRNLKRQLDSYVTKKNNLYSKYKIEDATNKMQQLNRAYSDFFNIPTVAEYMKATRDFNTMMESTYKIIEQELLK